MSVTYETFMNICSSKSSVALQGSLLISIHSYSNKIIYKFLEINFSYRHSTILVNSQSMEPSPYLLSTFTKPNKVEI